MLTSPATLCFAPAAPVREGVWTRLLLVGRGSAWLYRLDSTRSRQLWRSCGTPQLVTRAKLRHKLVCSRTELPHVWRHGRAWSPPGCRKSTLVTRKSRDLLVAAFPCPPGQPQAGPLQSRVLGQAWGSPAGLPRLHPATRPRRILAPCAGEHVLRARTLGVSAVARSWGVCWPAIQAGGGVNGRPYVGRGGSSERRLHPSKDAF